ncbi:FAS1 domain-containing protein [Dioscorea alata]|uniref:FAS1 domain-containing protein n=1 Tax=Dioscorea alata TaxID=55571 RepID=A0ACB7U039_DIOAL|nr:FAS1 domain-containing protein [Dioscorea alata]
MAEGKHTFFSILLVSLMVVVWSPAGDAHNITAILDDFPDYSLYNSYLTQTKVADEINSRDTVTCLVLPNAAMAALAAKRPLAAIKNALQLLTLLDYFDPAKLHNLQGGAVLSTTLLQTTGNEPGNLGFVNITNQRGGKVAFASAAPGSKPDATYTKSIKQVPYNLSVVEISAPITFSGLLDAPTASGSNLTGLLEKAGCKTFASLLSSSGVLKIFQSAMTKGLTLFAPNDEAFKAPGIPDLASLSSAELVTVLQYHALASYTPKASLKTATGRLATMASSGAGKYDLGVVTRGDDVSLSTGVDSSRVASTILDDTPVCVLTVDSILLPVELFGKAPSPAPAPGPAATPPSPTPSPVEAPAPSPKKAKSHPKKHHSPPAPPASSPATESPSDAPAADEKAADDKSAAPAMLAGTLTSLISIIVALVSVL